MPTDMVRVWNDKRLAYDLVERELPEKAQHFLARIRRAGWTNYKIYLEEKGENVHNLQICLEEYGRFARIGYVHLDSKTGELIVAVWKDRRNLRKYRRGASHWLDVSADNFLRNLRRWR